MGQFEIGGQSAVFRTFKLTRSQRSQFSVARLQHAAFSGVKSAFRCKSSIFVLDLFVVLVYGNHKMLHGQSRQKRSGHHRITGQKMNGAKHTAMEIADWFLRRVDRESGDSITHLKLQKLVYYAQAWYLANHGKPLIEEDCEAWAHGPVFQSVYDKFKNNSWDALPATPKPPTIDGAISSFLEQVYKVYGPVSAKVLENQTHKEAPWVNTRGDLRPEARCNSPIKKTMIRDFYAAKIGKNWRKQK